MNFEVQNALTSLDERTPDFFIMEALRDANPRHKLAALAALRDLDETSATKRLLALLSLY